jgi:YjjG family noncanonical pyrimidine nucleotidase
LFQIVLDSYDCIGKLAGPVNAVTISTASEPCVSRTSYQWLLFDADGTLFDFERAESLALRHAFERMGISYDPVYLDTYKKINQALWLMVEKGELLPGEVKVRRFELFLKALQFSHSPTVFSENYVKCLGACSELIDGAAEVIQVLKGKYQLAILTNGLKDVQRNRLAGSIIRHHVSELIISEEVGFAKPAKEYFDAAFTRLGHPPKSSVLMIGDGWASDIQGAAQYGIDVCWYNPGRQTRPSNPEITREITSLSELIAWLV